MVALTPERAIRAKLPRLRGREKKTEEVVVQALDQQPIQPYVLVYAHPCIDLLEQFRGDTCISQKSIAWLTASPHARQYAMHEGDRNGDWRLEHQEARRRELRSFVI